MKKILVLFLFFITSFFYAQNGITYQAVIYKPNGDATPGFNNTNVPLALRNICIQFSIIDHNNQTEYQENSTITTDKFGMVNLLIGTGNQVGGYASSFNNIDWDTTVKSLVVNLDITGDCSNFEEISNQPFSVVPFAYNSFNATNATNITGIVPIENGGTNGTSVQEAKTNLDLDQVDNTNDLNKPISNATQTALNTKENTNNKSTDATLADATNTKFPTALAVKTYVTNQIANGTAANVSGIVGIANGGTGSATQNFVDLSTNQTISGVKLFSSNASFNGQRIGKGNATGGENLAVGAGAMNAVSTGVRNTAIGNSAMLNYIGTSFDNNTSLGYANLISLTTGSGNTSVGAESMMAVLTGSSNTSIGNQSLINNTGNNNIGVGKSAGSTLTSGSQNTIIGTNADVGTNTLNNASALGYAAKVNTSNTIQLGNTSVTNVNTSGTYTGTGFKTPTGTANQFLKADGSVDTNNYFLTNTSNVAIGYVAGTGGQGTHSIAIGSNVAQGAQAEGGVAIGYAAAQYNQGTNAVALGSFAGNNNQPENAVAIGYNAQTNGINSIAIGAGALAQNANTIQLGNTNISNINTSGTITAGTVTYPNTHNATAGQILITNALGVATWGSPAATVTEIADEYTNTTGVGTTYLTAGQTSFTLTQAPAANSKVKMYVNGIRISNTAYAVSGSTLTYLPVNNGGYVLSLSDRIQFDYFY
jgi:hypothetical protein